MLEYSKPTIYGCIIPNFTALWRLAHNSKLSKAAKHRLTIIDYYYQKSNQNAALTARHFGCSRSYIYKLLKIFNPKYLPSLEPKSRRPHHPRTPTYDHRVVALIRQYREDTNTAYYSAKKLASIFWSDYKETHYHISPATIGRIIKKHNLYFHANCTLKTRSTLAKKRRIVANRLRKPASLKAMAPREVIEFDMKHFSANGQRYYCFCAIDQFSKEAVIHCARSCTSGQAEIALKKSLEVFGERICIVNDNGSENLGLARNLLKGKHIDQYFTRPYSPKEKGCVERFIGSYDRECLTPYQQDIHSVEDLDYYTTQWLNNYHMMRPHMSLKDPENKYHFFSPYEFCAIMNTTILRRDLSTMY